MDNKRKYTNYSEIIAKTWSINLASECKTGPTSKHLLIHFICEFWFNFCSSSSNSRCGLDPLGPQRSKALAPMFPKYAKMGDARTCFHFDISHFAML